MKKILTLVAFTLTLSGCSSSLATQKIKELEAGQNYEVSTLLELEEGVTAEITNDEIVIDELGTYVVEFNLTKDGKEKLKKFKYKVVDTTAPTITKTRDLLITQGEEFKLSDYFKVEDNVKSNLIEQATLDTTIDTNKLGEQEFTISVKDTSGNETSNSFTINVVEPRILAQLGSVVSVEKPSDANSSMDVSFDKIYFTNEIRPAKPASYYSYLKDKVGEQFLVLEMTVTNTGGKDIDKYSFESSDWNLPIKAEVVFDEKYSFNGVMKYEIQSNTIENYFYIKPFKSSKVSLIVSVSDEVVGKPFDFSFILNDTQYYITGK